VTSATTTSVTVEWVPSTDNVEVIAYEVAGEPRPGRDREVRVKGPMFTADRLSCGVSFELQIAAVDRAGNRSLPTQTTVSTTACSDSTPPTPPSGFRQAATSQDAVVLVWDPSNDDTGVVGYGVYRDGVPSITSAEPSATISGLSCGSVNQVAIDAFDAAGNRSARQSTWVQTAACPTPPPPPPGDTTPPSQPSSLAVSSSTQTSVALTWGASSDNVGVVGYGVYRNGTLVATVTQPGSTVSGLVCGTAYTFAVDAYDGAGNRSSKASLVTATASCPDAQAPTAPSNVQTTARTATSLALSWSPSSDNVGVVGYGLYRDGSLVGTPTTTSGIFAGLACNTNYTLAVDAYDGAGNRSSKATVMVATTACPDTSPPSAPTGLSISNVSQAGATLAWNASSDNVGVAGYDVYLDATKVSSTTTRSFAFAGLSCGTAYALGVSAYDAAGNSSNRTTTTVSTSACSAGTEWAFCSNEGARCAFTGTKEVRYGATGTWTTPRAFTGGVDCNNQVFGDPAPGVTKSCEARSTISSSPSSLYPASYYTGPLGQNNILPSKPGALLIVWPNGVGWPAQQARVSDLESRMGRRLDGIGTHYGGGGTFNGNANCMWNSGERREQWIHDRGSYPIVSWSPDRPLSDVNAGALDGCFRSVADYYKGFSFKIMLRMWWEFNGNWMIGSGCGQTYIDAWRRVVGIFRERGATNVGFWWSPQEGYDRTCSSNSYPGDAYVDWVGSDAYNWCGVGESGCWSSPLHSGWAQFGEIFDYGSNSAHDTFGSRKPFVVGETNTIFDAGSAAAKGQWYRNVPAAAQQMEHLTGVQFFDVDVTAYEGPKSNWPVDYPTSVPSALDGFVALARDPYFNAR